MNRSFSSAFPSTDRAPWGKIGVAVYLPLLLLLGGTGVFATVRDIPAGDLFRDPTAVLNAPLYVGALSLVGLFLWTAAAALCFFTTARLWRSAAPRSERTFFLGAGLLTTVLLLDDAFLFHESIAPHDLGISSSVVYAAYGTAVVGLFWAHQRAVWNSAYSILGVSVVFLAAGVGIDLMIDHDFILPSLFVDAPGLEYYLEDGAKLFGIAGWGTYFGWTGYQRLAERISLSFARPTVLESMIENGHPAAGPKKSPRLSGHSRFRAS